MRIWDVDPTRLCRQHLLGEHRELHAAWNVLVEDRHGYRAHPEVSRWRGKQAALYRRHDLLVAEMIRRGFRHRSPLDPGYALGATEQETLLATAEEQLQMLAAKRCECPLPAAGSGASGRRLSAN